ncbi:virulence protein [Dehalococcoides sp.]|uniref:virulence protein n=1 Tax=Dehalococcoides sp. TaxID=1966486 RepID=UPI002ACB1532|nr:virulence protein [Dehalococcoides sp.]
MTINFNVSGNDRKRLVELISQITEAPVKYLGVPSCAYQVADFTISKNGELAFADNTDKGKVEMLIERLSEASFEAEIQTKETELVIQMPRAAFSDAALENLDKLIEAKGNLIKKALLLDALPVETDEERISFPWFTSLPDADEVKAYTLFISKLCEMAQNQTRITAKEKEVDNDKYAFRCFLLRLGFIGAEYKTERKILLRNLSGSSAFKGGPSNEANQ